MDTPRYPHNCTNCTFLGQFEEYDLYFCPQGGFPTVIARFGEFGDYFSGLCAAHSVESLGEAKKRAINQGLIPA